MSDLAILAPPAAPPAPRAAALAEPKVVAERPARCASCDAPRTGTFCAACGQRHIDGRFTLRGVVARLLGDAFDLERGHLHTALALAHRPAEVVREYVSGRTARFTNPVKYFVICLTLAQLAAWQVGATRGFVQGFLESQNQQSSIARAAELADQYFVALAGLGLPFLALFTRRIFRRAGANAAEHLVFNLFVVAQQNLFFVLTTPLLLLLPPRLEYHLSHILLLGQVAFYTWAAKRFFRTGLFRAFFGTLLAFVLMMATYSAIASLVAMWLRDTPA